VRHQQQPPVRRVGLSLARVRDGGRHTVADDRVRARCERS
jgi:hypothetical protein